MLQPSSTLQSRDKSIFDDYVSSSCVDAISKEDEGDQNLLLVSTQHEPVWQICGGWFTLILSE